jgi:hypothetical protein
MVMAAEHPTETAFRAEMTEVERRLARYTCKSLAEVRGALGENETARLALRWRRMLFTEYSRLWNGNEGKWPGD